MQTVTTSRSQRTFRIRPFSRPAAAALAGLWLVAAGPCLPAALAFDISRGELSGRLDTTVSLGAAWRMESRDPDIVGVANGGNANSINSDNGNLNYDRDDLISASAKVTHELDLSYGNVGFFGRMLYFYDYAVMDEDTARTPLSDEAEHYVGRDLTFLDAYVTADLEIADRPVTLRAGNMVLSWGESTFIQNGINVINPVDVSKLRVAGAELRDALVPVPMVSMNANVSDNLSFEAFYQLEWEHTEIEPEGTYFSTSDHASPGGEYVFLQFGQPPVTDNPPLPAGSDPPLGTWVPRGEDRDADDEGQGGVALRYFSPELNDTEFGLYFLRYHSRLPVLSGRAGGPPPRLKYLPDFVTFLDWAQDTGDYASTAEYYREFPEDIDVLGMSFSTDVSSLGLAVQGEVSYRWDQPLQVDDVELLFSAISPLDDTLRLLKVLEGLIEEGRLVKVPDQIFGRSQLGTVEYFENVQGYRRKDMVQPQVTVTKLFGPMLGADQLVVLGEAGATWILDMEEKEQLRYEGPGTFTGGDPFFTQTEIQPATQTSGFADDFSWGYRLAARADFNNALGAVNLQPSIAFAHDVEGTTPLPVANFVEDRKTITLALGANYLNAVRAKLSYTTYFDGGAHNLINDRDFIQITADYSF